MPRMNANGLITTMAMEIKNGNLKKIEAMGLDIETMQILHNLTIDQLNYLTNSSISVFSLEVNKKNLSILLKQANQELERSQNITRALNLEASIEIMSAYFGLTGAEVTARRKLAGITCKIGRTESPSDELSEKIYRLWETHKVSKIDTMEALEKMMVIGEKLNCSLTTILSLVKEWDKIKG